jgi:hypothetical protein
MVVHQFLLALREAAVEELILQISQEPVELAAEAGHTLAEVALLAALLEVLITAATELFLQQAVVVAVVGVVLLLLQRLELAAQVQPLLVVAVAAVHHKTALTLVLAVLAAMVSAVFISGKVKI